MQLINLSASGLIVRPQETKELPQIFLLPVLSWFHKLCRSALHSLVFCVQFLCLLCKFLKLYCQKSNYCLWLCDIVHKLKIVLDICIQFKTAIIVFNIQVPLHLFNKGKQS